VFVNPAPSAMMNRQEICKTRHTDTAVRDTQMAQDTCTGHMHRTQAEGLLEGFQGKGHSRVQDDGAGHFHLAESIGHGEPCTIWAALCHHHAELHTLQGLCVVKNLLKLAHNHTYASTYVLTIAGNNNNINSSDKTTIASAVCTSGPNPKTGLEQASQ